MGSRVNICLEYQGTESWLYAHWHGHYAPAMLARALQLALQETEASGTYSPARYAASIRATLCVPRSAEEARHVFSCEPGPIGANFPTLRVDLAARTVSAAPEEGDGTFLDIPSVVGTWSFARFCELAAREDTEDRDAWDSLRGSVRLALAGAR